MMDAANLLVLILTFLAVSFICWGLVVIYCCVRQVCLGDCEGRDQDFDPALVHRAHLARHHHFLGLPPRPLMRPQLGPPMFAEHEPTKIVMPMSDIVYI